MKIAVISDLHFGYGYGTELELDSFENADEAVQAAVASGADIILVPGDIFDSRFPRTEVLANAAKVLARPLLEKNRGVKLAGCSKKLRRIARRSLQHMPVVAIHGTHERRHGANTIEALENAGMLIHLHKETICLEKDGVRIAIHGMSGVPERYAKQALEEWNPQPLPDCVNILMLHQSIDPFIYSPLEPAMLKLGDLPKGFDLIIDGHLHMHGIEKVGDQKKAGGGMTASTPLVFPGSTVITQFEENEANSEKGFYLADIEKGEKPKIKFVPLKNSRKFFLREIKAGAMLRTRMEREIDAILANGTDNFAKRPVVKIKITGNASDVVEQELKEIEKEYAGRLLLKIAKQLESAELESKIEFLRSVREQKLSVEEMGLQLLRKNLEELKFAGGFDCESMFGILVDGNVDNAFNILTGGQKTLK